jgi:hypothetical protein
MEPQRPQKHRETQRKVTVKLMWLCLQGSTCGGIIFRNWGCFIYSIISNSFIRNQAVE